MNEEAPQEAPADKPSACTRIVNHEVVVPLTTDVRGSNSSSTEPFGVSGARLRLDTPAKSSAKTTMRNRAGSNPVRSYVETCASTPWTEAAARGEPSDCRRLQFTSELLGNPYSRVPATVLFPPKISTTASAPIPSNWYPVDGFPSASIRK